METIVIPTPEHSARALYDAGLTTSPVPESAFWTVTTGDGTVRFVVLDRLMKRVAETLEFAEPDRCGDIIDALIRFVEEEGVSE